MLLQIYNKNPVVFVQQHHFFVDCSDSTEYNKLLID